MAIPTPPKGAADIGVTGMAVMGSNLARNLARNGFKVAIHTRSVGKTEKVAAEHGGEGEFYPAESMADFVNALSTPRVAIIMVKAGAPTDAVIEELASLMDPGDIIVDCGNSNYHDTRRREADIRARGLHFVGSGVSGGEEGALNGPSIMPGGTAESYNRLGPMFETISAHVDGVPCCTHVGPDGAGHFVKMVHNGIEYADMQFIGEAYELLRALGLDHTEMADIFATWNTGDLDSYLIEITAEVLRKTDPRTGVPLVDVIRDAAGMKGTGTWTVQSALDLGTPVNTIAESVFARAISSSPELRAAARAALHGPDRGIRVADRDVFVEQVRQALWASKVVAYAQGLDEIRMAAAEYGWSIDIAEVARIWRAGCIIRARLLERIRSEYAAGNLVTLLEAPSIVAGLTEAQEGWRTVVAEAVRAGVPVPGFSAALAHYDQARAPRLNAALTQGMRDYFGAHTYRRIDDEGAFHINWSTDGAEVAAD